MFTINLAKTVAFTVIAMTQRITAADIMTARIMSSIQRRTGAVTGKTAAEEGGKHVFTDKAK